MRGSSIANQSAEISEVSFVMCGVWSVLEPVKRIPFEVPYTQPENSADLHVPQQRSDLGQESDEFLSPHANDDDPKFPVFWQLTAQSLRSDSRTTLMIGALGGVLAAGLLYLLFSSLFATETGSSLIAPILITGLTGAALFVLSIVTERISRLASIITKTSEFEKNLNNSGRVAALSRELQYETSQIESRIERFLSVGSDLRQQLHLESDTLNTAYSEKLVSLRTTIEDLDSARLSFLNEIDFVNKAIEIGKNFLTAKIGAMSTDFEDAAMAATRVLETRLLEISQKVNTTIASDIVQKRNFERLIATNNSVIELMNSTPELLNLHLSTLSDVIDNGFRQKVDVLNKKIEELSQHLADTGAQWVDQIQSTPGLIEKHLAEANSALTAVLEIGHENLDLRINIATNDLREINEKFAAKITEAPIEIGQRITHASQLIDESFKTHQEKLDQYLAKTTSELDDLNEKLKATVERAPEGIEKHVVAATRSIENAIETGQRAINDSAKAAAHDIGSLNDTLIAVIRKSPRDIETSFDGIEAAMASAVGRNIKSAKVEVEALVESLEGASEKINAVIQETPNRMGEIVSHLTPAFENGLTENIKNAEVRISEFLDMQSRRIDETIQATSGAISNVVEEFNQLNPKLSSEIEAQANAIQNSIESASSMLETKLKTFEYNFNVTKEKTIGDISNLVSSQVSQMRMIIEQARLEANTAIGGAVSQQNTNLREFETRLGQLTKAFSEATEHANIVQGSFAETIDTQIAKLKDSSTETIELFKELLAENSRAIGTAFMPDFAEISRNAEAECIKLEDRLQISLAKFYEIVKRCTETIEESAIKKLDDEIRHSDRDETEQMTEVTKSNSHEEFDRLTERLKSKIEAIKSSREPSSNSARRHSQDTDQQGYEDFSDELNASARDV